MLRTKPQASVRFRQQLGTNLRRLREGAGLSQEDLMHLADKGAGHRVTGNRRSQFKSGRGADRRKVTGWEFVHVCVDDATRMAYAEVLTDEKGPTAAGFLRRAAAWFASMGVTVERVLSDNGACYVSRARAAACSELGLRHLRARPYRPRTNGKAERFIQTMTDRWAYGTIYASSMERTAALPGWLDHYNFRRRHGSLGHGPPSELRRNVLKDAALNTSMYDL